MYTHTAQAQAKYKGLCPHFRMVKSPWRCISAPTINTNYPPRHLGAPSECSRTAARGKYQLAGKAEKQELAQDVKSVNKNTPRPRESQRGALETASGTGRSLYLLFLCLSSSHPPITITITCLYSPRDRKTRLDSRVILEINQ
jgi:hypothetical protein